MYCLERSNLPREKIAVIGLGKLGLCLAVVLTSKGYSVSGIDTDVQKIELISSGKSPIFEPKLQRLLRKNRDRLSVSTSYDEIEKCYVTFVIVPTPSERTGEFSLFFVKRAMENIGKVLS